MFTRANETTTYGYHYLIFRLGFHRLITTNGFAMKNLFPLNIIEE